MVARNQFAFEADLDKFAKTVGLGLTTVRKKVAFDLFAGIVKRTPVDTGRARFGWAMTDNAPSAHAPDGPGPTPTASQQPATFNDPFGLTVIVNNVPYIVPLEFGSSKQSPLGMVRISIVAVEAGLLAQL